ncbi:MAG TPA: carboxymuconolactone decarboxylase family protein [Solirubrobacterales bacterium]|nr:carboxymuconolactone decarboxylase family protein [Solirubrobacterales bacterium]
MTIKTEVSRFHIHDELTAPDGSAPLIKSIQTAGGAVSKFLGVIAESPSTLRAYTRMRSELRKGELPQATRERIGLAVAERRDDAYTLNQYARTARAAGLGLDEVARAREFSSSDEKEAALLALLKVTIEHDDDPPHHLVEEAREAGWSDSEIIEAVAELALAEFQSLFSSAAELPLESSDPAVLRSAAA